MKGTLVSVGRQEQAETVMTDFSNTFTALVGLALASPTRLRQKILCRRSAGFSPLQGPRGSFTTR